MGMYCCSVVYGVVCYWCTTSRPNHQATHVVEREREKNTGADRAAWFSPRSCSASSVDRLVRRAKGLPFCPSSKSLDRSMCRDAWTTNGSPVSAGARSTCTKPLGDAAKRSDFF